MRDLKTREKWTQEDIEDAIGVLQQTRNSWGYALLRNEIDQNISEMMTRIESFDADDRLIRQMQGALRAFKLIVGDPAKEQADMITLMIEDLRREQSE